MLKDFLELFFLNPVSIVFMLNLKDVLIFDGSLNFDYLKYFLSPFAVTRSVGLHSVTFTQTVLNLTEQFLLGTLQTHDTDSADQF